MVRGELSSLCLRMTATQKNAAHIGQDACGKPLNELKRVNMSILNTALGPYKRESRYVTWRLETRNGKGTKVPYSPVTGNRAKSNDPSTWGTIDAAERMMRDRADLGLDGIGIMLGDGLIGIDMDHVIDADGQILPAAAKIINALDTYTELSPSGTGIHLLVKADGEYTGKHGSDIFKDAAGTAGAAMHADIEMYPGGRYFTLTGKPYGDLRPIAERTNTLDSLCERLWPKPKKDTGSQIQPRTRAVSRSDADVLDKMRRHNPNAAALYDNRDMSRYDNDHSRADLALAAHLLYWTDGDKQQADQLFRASALMRDKWDKICYANGDTYGQRTLDTAYAYYETQRVQKARQEFARNGTADDSLDDLNLDDLDGEHPEGTIQLPRIESTQADYLSDGTYTAEIAYWARHANDTTGYAAIDACNPFYPGLYVLGAASSLGKTTFCLQLADQIAAMGRDVLYITLEQTAAELTCKSIARCAYDLCRSDESGRILGGTEDYALSALQLRRGNTTPLTDRALQMYAQTIAPHMHIIRGSFRTRAADVVYRVRQWMGEHKNAMPLVIVDYLQALAPTDIRQTDKQKVDAAMGDLKDLQCECDLTVLAVSSLNRANYLVPVSFESFKESGNIEYSADVVWGLDLACLYDPFFDTAGHIIEKREIIQQAREDGEREIYLRCLKNRFGKGGYHVPFYYAPLHDSFRGASLDSKSFVFPSRLGTYHDRLARARNKYCKEESDKGAARIAMMEMKREDAQQREEYRKEAHKRRMLEEEHKTTRAAIRKGLLTQETYAQIEARAQQMEQTAAEAQRIADAQTEAAKRAARDTR